MYNKSHYLWISTILFSEYSDISALISCCHPLTPKCHLMLQAFKLVVIKTAMQSESSPSCSLELKEGTQIYMTSGLVVGVVPQQQRDGSLLLYPWLLKWRLLPWMKHFSACKERTDMTGWEPKHLSAEGGPPEGRAITLPHSSSWT